MPDRYFERRDLITMCWFSGIIKDDGLFIFTSEDKWNIVPVVLGSKSKEYKWFEIIND